MDRHQLIDHEHEVNCMNWNPDRFLTYLYEKESPAYRFQANSQDEWKIWQKDLRNAFADVLGLPKIPRFLTAGSQEDTLGDQAKMAVAVEWLEDVQLDGYRRQRISLPICPELDMPIYILTPAVSVPIPDGSSRKPIGAAPVASDSTAKRPVVVAIHGHGYGSRDLVGLRPDGVMREPGEDKGYQKDFALELVRHGFVVLVPEVVGFGDMRLSEDMKERPGTSSCHRLTTNLEMMGLTLGGLRVFQIQKILDYLETRADLDAERIGCMGISGGGLVCAFASALDERIKAAVVSGYTNTFKSSVLAIPHCIDNFFPNLVRVAEMPDLIGLIAPRPLLVESGTEDSIFPVAAVREAYTQLEKIYGLLDAGEKLDLDLFPGDHQIGGVKAYPWLQRWL
jgi:dienelactone hydrolase